VSTGTFDLEPRDVDRKGRPRSSMRFVTRGGARVYLLPVETFPGHVNNLYLVCGAGPTLLFDAGSGLADSERELADRFVELGDRFGERVRVEDVARCLISHAHIDHFGGAATRRRMGASILVHELDARVITRFEERVVLASKDLSSFMRRAGVPGPERAELEVEYRAYKFFRSVDVDQRLRDGDVLEGGLVVHHMPGHCPGLVTLEVDDLILTTDQLLARTTPVQTPQSITAFTGLENFLRSLKKLVDVCDRSAIVVGLGGHEMPIGDVRRRAEETWHHHRNRLDRVRAICAAPHTTAEIAWALFGEQHGYGKILAYAETGAHVEYLHALGELVVANLDDFLGEGEAVPRFALA